MRLFFIGLKAEFYALALLLFINNRSNIFTVYYL